jgi:hypothetical protein
MLYHLVLYMLSRAWCTDFTDFDFIGAQDLVLFNAPVINADHQPTSARSGNSSCRRTSQLPQLRKRAEPSYGSQVDHNVLGSHLVVPKSL